MICAFSQRFGEKRSQHRDHQGRKILQNSKKIAGKGPVWIPSCKHMEKKVQDMAFCSEKGPQNSIKIAEEKGKGMGILLQAFGEKKGPRYGPSMEKRSTRQ